MARPGLALLVLFSCLLHATLASAGAIRGVAWSDLNGSKKFAPAQVDLWQGGQFITSTTADLDGLFEFHGLSAGTWELIGTFGQSLTGSCDTELLTAQDEVVCDIELTP